MKVSRRNFLITNGKALSRPLPDPLPMKHDPLRYGLGILILLPALAAAAAAGEPLKWNATVAGLPPNSISGSATTVTFENKSDREVKIFWVKYNGEPKFYGELKPGGVRQQNTFANSSWLITDADEEPLGYFRTTHRAGIAIIPKHTRKPVLRAGRYTSRSKADAVAWQKQMRAAFFKLLRMQDLASGQTPNPLAAKVLSSADRGKYRFQEMEISSTPASRIKVVLTLPKNVSGPCPAVVAIAGHSGTRHSCYAAGGFASLLAEAGYATVSTKISQHSIRERDRTMMGERLWDLMRCVDLLASLAEVDAGRIGCAGNSLGGEMAMWLAAMDERIAATVSAGFLTRMDQLEKNHCRCWKFAGLRELADFADVYALTAPRALLCQNGLQERPTWFTVPIAREALHDIRPIYADFGKPENLQFLAHPGGHIIEVPSLRIFFEKHLQGPD